MGVTTAHQLASANKKKAIALRDMYAQGKAGEADRKILTKKPRHLFTGKRSNGTNDRR
ncbi:Nucleolar GTP-binding protein 1 [Coemansia sp. RSA 1199]|nr:Nucleolar GTP-binding protein 1 [Coemansia sp. RSA 1199]